MAPPTQSALIAKKVGEVELAFFASAKYLDRHGMPSDMAGLKDHVIIGFDGPRRSIKDLAGTVVDVSRETFDFRSDSDLAQLAMVCADYGIGVCQPTIARRRGLVRVMPDVTVFNLGVWIVMHENLRASRRMRLMFDHLVDGTTSYIKEGRNW
jgi:DNA-binding transcriptional LysR family regulator